MSAEMTGWEERDGALWRSFTFADFSEAFGFLTRVALAVRRPIITPSSPACGTGLISG